MVNIGKRGRVLFVVLSLSIFLIILNQSVLAQGFPYSLEDFLFRIWNEGFAPIFGLLFGTSAFDELLFAKILFFLIIFSVIFMVLKNIDIFAGNRPVAFIVTVSVSILSIRFMGDNQFIRGILLPYQVLGVAIIVFLPLLIYALFVNTSVSGKFGRRFAWALYVIVFLVLWISRQSDISTADVSEINWIYGLGFAFIVVNLIFDGPIHEYLGSRSFRKARRNYHIEQKSRYAERLEDLERRRHLINPSEYERLKSDLTRGYSYHARKS